MWLKPQGERGQSMVEMALAFPILLLILAGTLEVGKYFNDYLTILDATREAARYAADGDLFLAAEPSLKCDDNFYHQAACLAQQNISGIGFNKDTDDIVVSAMSVDSNGHILRASRARAPIRFRHRFCLTAVMAWSAAVKRAGRTVSILPRPGAMWLLLVFRTRPLKACWRRVPTARLPAWCSWKSIGCTGNFLG